METISTDKNQFVHYIIPEGSQFSDKSQFVEVNYDELRFTVVFDSSAIYQTMNPLNQADVNKLYGFSDNGGHHHQNSARFGWRWNGEHLLLFAYVYNSGVRTIRELSRLEIGQSYDCSIKVKGSFYFFRISHTIWMMPRASAGLTGKGYKLFPYFGGDEKSPHDISIYIAEN